MKVEENILLSYEQDEAKTNHRFTEINNTEDLLGHLFVHC